MYGHGAPVILLHGNGEDLHIFDKLVRKLKEDFTVYAIDSRNHGKSTGSSDFSYDAMAKDVYLFIEKLRLKNVSVIGFSDGAITSLLAELKHPGLFHKMVLLGVNLKPSDFKDEIYAELTAEYEKTKDPLVKLMIEQPDIELQSLKSIHTPTLVIAASNDIYKEETFPNLVKAMADAKLIIIQEHDHGSYVIGQDILYPYLIPFLKE